MPDTAEDLIQQALRARREHRHEDAKRDFYRKHPETPPLDLANAIRGLALLKSDSKRPESARALWHEARELYAAVNVEAGVAESNHRLALLTKDF